MSKDEVLRRVLSGTSDANIMNKYEIIIYWSDEDQAFVAEVPELPGCAAHGPTQEAALANAKEAIQLWIDTAKEFGDPIPAPKGRRLILA
jgi:predicted RNase H-like HicB family nuclease